MTNILFLCGSLEPGCDGVGDYCRRLAGAFIRSGANAAIISLNDTNADSNAVDYQTDELTQIPVLRLRNTLRRSEKIASATAFIGSFKPQWISLQYVPYAFHSKGLPFSWISCFRQLASGCKWHINLHELWIGSSNNDSLKNKVIGVIQRKIIQLTIQSINPVLITTSVPYYRNLLVGLNFNALIQPIFSNLPIGDKANLTLYKKLPAAVRTNRAQYVIAIFFGTIHVAADTIDKIEKLRDSVSALNKELLILHVGRFDNASVFLKAVEKKTGCHYLTLGEQTAIDIASLFKAVDIGISTYTFSFLGKSGSIAAMLNNGLPVVLLHRYHKETTSPIPFAKCIDDIGNLADFIEQPKSFSDDYSLSGTVSFYKKHLLTNAG